MSKPIFILISLVVCLVSLIGDYFVKVASNSPKDSFWKWLGLGAFVYAFTALGWFYIMKYYKLATIGVYYAVFTVILISLLGIIVFQEKINIYEIVGIILAIISIILMSRFA